MTLRRGLKAVKNFISVAVIMISLLSIMFLYFDYSAQLPLIITMTVLVTEYILFIILVRRVRVKLVSRDGNFTHNSSMRFEVLINKRSVYPFKKMEVYLCHISKYGDKKVKRKIEIEMKDRLIQGNIFKIDNLPYGYTDVIIENIYVYDLLGLGSRKIKVYSDKLKVFVMPKKREVDIELPKIPYIGGDDTEIFLEDRGKDSSELYDIREFRDGDKLRQIHWKLSSKTEDYMVRDLVTPIDTNIYVFFDLCNSEGINILLENAVSIAYKMLEFKYAFYIAWLDVETMRIKRKLVSEEMHIEDAVMELMRSPLYEKSDEVMNILDRFLKEDYEVYNLFILS